MDNDQKVISLLTEALRVLTGQEPEVVGNTDKINSEHVVGYYTPSSPKKPWRVESKRGVFVKRIQKTYETRDQAEKAVEELNKKIMELL
jgi:hypothetical protein